MFDKDKVIFIITNSSISSFKIENARCQNARVCLNVLINHNNIASLDRNKEAKVVQCMHVHFCYDRFGERKQFSYIIVNLGPTHLIQSFDR